jgi:capsular exopolysaccharide synthesis family protein
MSRIYAALEEAEQERAGQKTAWDVIPMGMAAPPMGTAAPPLEVHANRNGPRPSTKQQELVAKYQNLWSTLQALPRAKRSQGIVVCSSVQREGTTTVAAELAIVCALHGSSKTLLVDANLRNPGVHRRFRTDRKPGLANVLAEGRAFPEEEIVASSPPGLFLLPAGDVPLDPLTAFESKEFKTLLQQLGEVYDHVILDCGPVHSCPETLNLAEQAGGVVLVVRAEHTRIEVVKAARDKLKHRSAAICGVVLNQRKYYIPRFIYRLL